jgi:hypothetical protein
MVLVSRSDYINLIEAGRSMGFTANDRTDDRAGPWQHSVRPQPGKFSAP